MHLLLHYLTNNVTTANENSASSQEWPQYVAESETSSSPAHPLPEMHLLHKDRPEHVSKTVLFRKVYQSPWKNALFSSAGRRKERSSLCHSAAIWRIKVGGFFPFFFNIKYVQDSYFFFPRFLETKTDTLVAVTSTTSCKSLSCKGRATKSVLSQSITAGFAPNWIRDQAVHSVLPAVNGGTPFSAPAASEEDICLCFQDQRKCFLLFLGSTSLRLPNQLFFFNLSLCHKLENKTQ